MNNNSFLMCLPTLTIKDVETNKYYIAVNININTENIYGDTMFFAVTDKLMPLYENDEIYKLLTAIKNANHDVITISDIIENGFDTFIPGVDYFISDTLANYLSILEYHMQDVVLVSQANVTINTRYEHIKYNMSDIQALQHIIKLTEYIFTEDELDNLYPTFFKLIRDNTTFTEYSYGTNAIYKAVIDYYAGYKSDCASVLINLILNSNYSSSVNSTSSCGCQSSSSCFTMNGYTVGQPQQDTVSYDTKTCLEKYQDAMYEYLVMMLSDVQFYCDWMYNHDTLMDDEPNTALIDKLIQLLTEFLGLGYNLSLSGNDVSTCGCHKSKYCPSLDDTTNDDNCSNRAIIMNYIKVLNWVKNDEVSQNINKIKIYGQQFASILPLLIF